MSWLLVIDVLLGLGLLFLAWQAVIGGTLFRGSVMFIVFGMVLSLVWARLGSPDLAMAEAAIGAGVTGALILITYWRLKRVNSVEPRDPSPARSRIALFVAVLSGVLVGAISLAMVASLEGEQTAARAMKDALPDTGVGNPITGVLLIFRNLDTLLEVAVVLAAYVAARAVLRSRHAALPVPSRAALLRPLVTTVAPLAVVVAVYLLKAGGQLPGGAFQASATLAALGVMLVLTGRLRPVSKASALTRAGLAAGTLSFCLLGLGMLVAGEAVLAMPGIWAVYLIETAMMVSIALALVLLFAASEGVEGKRP